MTTSEKPSPGPDEPTSEFEASRTVWDRSARPEGLEDPVLGHWLDGRFHALSRIGEGGMGAVYEVVDREGRQFAAKVVSGETVAKSAALPARGSGADWKRVLQRFVREAAAAREVRDAHVVKTIELGVDEELGLPFIVMELLHGIDLGALIKKHAPLPPEVVARIGVEAARGLAAVHAAGIVHRDVKPSNIFLHTHGDRITVKVCDFGIAKQLAAGDQTSSELTHTGGVLGSPRYMAPEQVTSARDVDATADVYGLCASLYEAASGRALWSGRSSLGELIVAICTERLPELSAVAPWVPRELAATVHRGLTRARRQRWQAMRDLADALSAHAAGEPLTTAELRSHDVSGSPAPEGDADEALSSVDALDPGFVTQGVANVAIVTPPPARAVKPTDPAPPRARARYALLALGAAAVIGAVAFSSSRGSRAPTPEPVVAPAALRVVPSDATVLVNGRVAEVRAGRVELSGQPGDAFDVALERGGRRRSARVYITSAGGSDPPLLELPPAPQRPVPVLSAAPAGEAVATPVPSAERAPKPRLPGRTPREPAAALPEPAPAAAKPLPTVLEPKDQW